MKYLRMQNNRGNVLIFTILVVVILFVIMSSLSVLMISEIRQSGQIEDSANAYLAAEAGSERALNYANHRTPIYETNQRLGAAANSPTYSFEVKEATAGGSLSDGTRCDTNTDPNLYYCFYSEGYSGSGKIVRKLSGYTRINSINQTTAVDFSTYPTQPPWSLFPSSPSQTVSLMDITPPDPRHDTLVLSGQIEGLNVPSADHYFGLLDSGSGLGNRKGIGMHVYNSGGQNMIKLIGTTIDTDVAPPAYTPYDNGEIASGPGTGNPISIPINPGEKISFVLTYRRAASDPWANTATLQVNDITDPNHTHNYPCLGITTSVFSDRIFSYAPFYAYFLSPGSYKPRGGTAGGAPYLQLQDSGQTITLDNFILSTSGSTSDTLATGTWLKPGQFIKSQSGNYLLTYRTNGNLVLTNAGGSVIWQTGTLSTAGYASMQISDGNFVLYTPSWWPYWASNTTGHPNAYLKVTDDGHLRIYDANNNQIWSRP